MKDLLKSNILYYTLFALFLIVVGGILCLIQTGDLLIWFSHNRTDFFNQFFLIVTQMGEEPIYLVLGIGAFFYRFRYALLVPLTGFTVMLLAVVFKAIFAHPRPSVYFYKEIVEGDISVIEGLHLLTGYSSFPSGHTMSAFTLYTLLALVVSRKKMTAFVLFVMALLIGISRVYLVQHFLKDVYMGAIFGVLLASGIYWLQNRLSTDPSVWYNRSLLNFRKKEIAASR